MAMFSTSAVPPSGKDALSTHADRPTDGVVNRHGKPALEAPKREFTASEMIDLLRNLQTKMHDGQLRSAKEEIERNRIEQQKANDQQLAKIDEWIQKSKEAEKSGIWGKIFGWVGTIAAVVAAAVLTVAAVATTALTAGAAGPIMCVMAGIAVTSAALMLANQISSECGGPEISISNGIMHAVKALLVEFGVEPETAENIGNIVAGAGMLFTGAILVEPGVVGKMASAIALMSGADEQTAGYIGMGFGIASTVVVGLGMAIVTFGAGSAGAVGQAVGNISAKQPRLSPTSHAALPPLFLLQPPSLKASAAWRPGSRPSTGPKHKRKPTMSWPPRSSWKP